MPKYLLPVRPCMLIPEMTCTEVCPYPPQYTIFRGRGDAKPRSSRRLNFTDIAVAEVTPPGAGHLIREIVARKVTDANREDPAA